MAKLTRRSALLIATGSILSARAIKSYATEKPEQVGADYKTIDKWMNEWKSKTPVGVLKISRFSDPMYFLLQPIDWKPSPGQDAKLNAVHVPIGFVTDFASIPQAFWSALKPDGIYAYAAVLHDYLYWHQQASKDEADKVFDACMMDFGVGSLTRDALYQAVHLFGGWAWDQNRQEKKAGERRILVRTPDDPIISWAEWKKNPENFGPE